MLICHSLQAHVSLPFSVKWKFSKTTGQVHFPKMSFYNFVKTTMFLRFKNVKLFFSGNGIMQITCTIRTKFMDWEFLSDCAFS